MTESADIADSTAPEVDLVLRCQADRVVLEVRDHDSKTMISEWSRTWAATGDDGQSATECDPHVWWNSFGECWQEAISVHSAATIAGLWITGAEDVIVCVDADGELLRPALCGPDPRMDPDAKWLLSQLPGAAADWERITGSAPSSAQMVAKCSWLHRSETDLWNRIALIAPLSAWLAAKLAGASDEGSPRSMARPVISAGMAESTGLWSVIDRQYSRLICQIIDSNRDLMACLPHVATGGQTVATGQWNGIPVICG